eukprot:scaffold674_cov371-Prasinococcus_capsulatus_cf.AAC.1
MGLNWFIPALVKRRVGSSCGTTGLECTMVWPLLSKNLLNVSRTRAAGHSTSVPAMVCAARMYRGVGGAFEPAEPAAPKARGVRARGQTRGPSRQPVAAVTPRERGPLALCTPLRDAQVCASVVAAAGRPSSHRRRAPPLAGTALVPSS